MLSETGVNHLLLIASDQLIPNILSVHALKPRNLLVAVTEDMGRKRVVENMKSALEHAGLGHLCGRTAELEVHWPNNLAEVRKELEAGLDPVRGDGLALNITGGTKIMSIAAYEYARMHGLPAYYTDVDKPSEIVEVGSGDVLTVEHRLTMDEFLAAYGYKVNSRNGSEEAEPFVELAARCALQARQPFCFPGFLELQRLLENARAEGIPIREQLILARDRGIIDGLKQKAAVHDPTANPHFGRLDIKSIPPVNPGGWDHSISGELSLAAVRFIVSDWLPIFLFHLLDVNRDMLGIDDLSFNVELQPVGGKNNNEVDVVFTRRQMLYYVECKTGRQGHDRDVDALYKIEAVLHQMRALRGKTILVSMSDHVFVEPGNKPFGHARIKPELQDRLNAYNAALLTSEDVKALARAHGPDEQVRPPSPVTRPPATFVARAKGPGEQFRPPSAVIRPPATSVARAHGPDEQVRLIREFFKLKD